MAATKTVKVNQHPHSGSKKVGVLAEGHFGTKHFPEGCKWRYAKVLDQEMFEVFDESGAIIFQCPRYALVAVSGAGYTTPLWLSREYPTPAGE